MRVDAVRMRRNLDAGRGLVFSGQLLLELTEKGGMSREDAYRIIQGHAMNAFLSEGDFKAMVEGDARIEKTLGKGALERVFDLTRYLQHTDALFARVFEA
jgi:adenylosuccinate lyase